MINRQNYLDVKAYLDYIERVKQNDIRTVRASGISLRHLLSWANNTPFQNADKLRLTFPEYILTARRDGDDAPLASGYTIKILEHSRQFYQWAKLALTDYRKVSDLWIDTLRLRRSKGTQSKLTARKIWTVDDIIKIINTPEPDRSALRYRRDKAALAFLFLSGMRIGAFITLPINCVDIGRRRISQLPERGVQTKNSKAANTFLYPIPELLTVVKEWDDYINGQVNNKQVAWYTRIEHEGNSIDINDVVEMDVRYEGRRITFSQGLQALCQLSGIEYKSPHKLRHGHGVYGVKHSRNMAELKAVSQNLMHANIGITDGIYGRLPEDDIFEMISGMTQ